MKESVEKNDIITLVDNKFKKIIVKIDNKTDKFKGIGVLNPSTLIGKEFGKKIDIGNKKFWLLMPSLQDKLHSIQRQAQIILPRDSALISMYCSIETGQHVLEAGMGSGSLTIALANAVLPNGKIFSYDTRQDFIDHALNNIKRAKLDHLIIPKNKDVTLEIDENELDALILDIPNPWMAVENAWNALKVGGYFCSYSPLISQMEKTVEKLWEYKFIEIKTIENIQREMVVTSRGTRPSFDMLGHTGYITFARKVLQI